MNENDERFRSRYTTRTWKGCCVVPIVAVIGLLVISFSAGLFDRPVRAPNPADTTQTSPNRQEFIAFGKQFFAIAQSADELNEQGFAELERFSRQEGSAESVKGAFRKAAVANHEAAERYKKLAIPTNLAARDKLQVAIEKISQSFTARERACGTIIRWADDPQNQEIAREYAQVAESVNTLTQEGLRSFAEAAEANGVTSEDAREFLPESVQQKASQFRTAPVGGDAGIHKLGR